MKAFPFCELTAKEFDEFSRNHPYGSVFQSSKWYELQGSIEGREKAILCGVKDGDKVVGAAAVIRQHLPMGLCWGFLPRGPLLSYDKPEKAAKEGWALWGGMRLLMGRKRCVFLRAEWPATADDPMGDAKNWGLKAHAHFYPEHTIMVDLKPGEDEILKQMKQKGRYNIKIAKKHDVTVRKSKDVTAFYKLMEETTKRDRFASHKLKYYEKTLEIFGDEAELWLAEYKGKVLAGAIVAYFKDTCTYLFGASSNEDRNVMAPYLLHWEIMRAAKKRGMKLYDLFGVAPEGAKGHPWAGVTRFKEQFGGERVSYWTAREQPTSWMWYLVIRVRKFFSL